MSRIEELIRELCPRGVEFQQLGEVARIKAGPNINKRLIADRPGPYPVINSGREPLGHVDHFNVEDDPIGIASRGSVGLVTWTKGRFFRGHLNYSCTVGDPSLLDSRFLYYYLLRSDPEIQALATHQGIPALNAGALKTLRVPIPPLELQREIVRVLDKFTQLEAELEAELEARRAQYEHYRNALLMSSDERGVRNVSFGDIIRLNFGVRITKKNDSGTLYPVYGGGGESFRTDAFNREDEWVVSRFAMSANCVRRVDGKFWMLDSGFTFDVIDDAVDKDFVGQLLLSMQSIIFATSTQSAQKNIDVNGFKRLQVQLPSLATQQRVAASLANFDRIVNDLSIGLPAELAARRKQYEHYRDRLLTFKELAS